MAASRLLNGPECRPKTHTQTQETVWIGFCTWARPWTCWESMMTFCLPSWHKKTQLGARQISLTVFLCKVAPHATLEQNAEKSDKLRMLLNAQYFSHSQFLSFCSESAPKWPGKPLYKGKL